MSQPLFGCTIAHAMNGNFADRAKVIALLRQPHFTFMPCKHEVRCKPKDEETATAFLKSLLATNPQEAAKLIQLCTK